MSSKLSQQSLSSPLPGNSQPKRKKRAPVICPICEETVEDASSKKRGHDAIFCEGACQDWLHRQCAGLFKVNFDAAKASNLPFLCPCCRLSDKSTELSALKVIVDQLVAEVSKLKSFCSSVTGDNLASLTHSHSETKAASSSATSIDLLHSIKGPANKFSSSKAVQDRKFNVVVFGIEEMPDGSSRFAREKHDFSKLSQIFSDLEHNSDHSSSIRDCHRLGRYVKGKSSCRPLLVTLNSTIDVRSILQSYNNSSDTSITIKADLSTLERKTNAILLKERWRLITSGIDRKFIKIRGHSLFVRGKLHGSVLDSIFVAAEPSLVPSPECPVSSVINSSAASLIQSSTLRSSSQASQPLGTASRPAQTVPTIASQTVPVSQIATVLQTVPSSPAFLGETPPQPPPS